MRRPLPPFELLLAVLSPGQAAQVTARLRDDARRRVISGPEGWMFGQIVYMRRGGVGLLRFICGTARFFMQTSGAWL
ncbi:MAG: hypothetical protein KatS3mg052_1623 [Candidatus Roseilinea sp.]|nr:MAG: hypothetical protein KatS3mg052_1623 [Candidatus Roseilinea sp.]